MKRLSWFLVIALIVFSIGCRPRIMPGPNIFFETETIKTPAIDALSEVNVGEAMIATCEAQIIPTLILSNDATCNVKPRGCYRVKKGSLRLFRVNSEGRFFVSRHDVKIEVAGRKTRTVVGGIFLYNDRPDHAAIFFPERESFRFTPISNLHGVVIEKEYLTEGSFKRELVYNGKSGNTIFILYREFKGNMARPAFSQEIKYDLTDSKIIGYKNARFEIIDADNLSVCYKTIKHLSVGE